MLLNHQKNGLKRGGELILYLGAEQWGLLQPEPHRKTCGVISLAKYTRTTNNTIQQMDRESPLRRNVKILQNLPLKIYLNVKSSVIQNSFMLFIKLWRQHLDKFAQFFFFRVWSYNFVTGICTNSFFMLLLIYIFKRISHM